MHNFPDADVWTRFVSEERAPRRTNRRLRDGGPARHPRHYDPFDALDIGTLRPEFGGRCGGNAVQRSVF
jgi:hypothetical protein